MGRHPPVIPDGFNFGFLRTTPRAPTASKRCSTKAPSLSKTSLRCASPFSLSPPRGRYRPTGLVCPTPCHPLPSHPNPTWSILVTLGRMSGCVMMNTVLVL